MEGGGGRVEGRGVGLRGGGGGVQGGCEWRSEAFWGGGEGGGEVGVWSGWGVRVDGNGEVKLV